MFAYILPAALAPQLMNVVLTGSGNGTCYLSLEYDQQVHMHIYRITISTIWVYEMNVLSNEMNCIYHELANDIQDQHVTVRNMHCSHSAVTWSCSACSDCWFLMIAVYNSTQPDHTLSKTITISMQIGIHCFNCFNTINMVHSGCKAKCHALCPCLSRWNTNTVSGCVKLH